MPSSCVARLRWEYNTEFYGLRRWYFSAKDYSVLSYPLKIKLWMWEVRTEQLFCGRRNYPVDLVKSCTWQSFTGFSVYKNVEQDIDLEVSPLTWWMF